MGPKLFIWGGLIVGSWIGSYIPVLWGGSVFSITSIFLGGVGSLVGLWLGWKIGDTIDG